MQNFDELEISQHPQNVILIHGYGSGRYSWDLVVDRFPTGLQVQAINLVGFGATAPEPGFEFTFEEQARALAKRLSKINQPYTIVAHSMGAAIAIIAVLDYQLMPDRLILVAPVLFDQSTPFFINIQTIPLLSWLGSYLVPPSFQVDMVFRRIYKRFESVDPGLRQNYIDAFKTPYHRQALRKTAVVMSSLSGAQYERRFGEIGIPVDIIWSREDPLLNFENAEAFKSYLPKTRIFPIEDCGHAPQEECPDSFLEAISEILQGN